MPIDVSRETSIEKSRAFIANSAIHDVSRETILYDCVVP